jgi:hypothetical protein
MKLLLALLAVTAYAQQNQTPAAVFTGQDAPNPGICDKLRVGNMYVRSRVSGTGDIAIYNAGGAGWVISGNTAVGPLGAAAIYNSGSTSVVSSNYIDKTGSTFADSINNTGANSVISGNVIIGNRPGINNTGNGAVLQSNAMNVSGAPITNTGTGTVNLGNTNNGAVVN